MRDYGNFVGCLRDVVFNGNELINADYGGAFNISPICIYQNLCQRPTTFINGNQVCANNGTCIDLWGSYVCECKKYLFFVFNT
ncbi:unnamed protein product [Meloidogyne enterolobii]|uniref:Uncharacterized protein n=1 Tax=Meloidogyne enterolobii TaxID=390850 RepID=A0ACB1B368_MELEN